MVKPKKHLGQHFLQDEAVARAVAQACLQAPNADGYIEIGPGTGALTEKLLAENPGLPLILIETDSEAATYIRKAYPDLKHKLIEADFLRQDVGRLIRERFGPEARASIIGNFPYNISSQIVFKTLEHRDSICGLTGMFQKEVAERICAAPGSKTYGILSVLTAAFFDREYLFEIPPEAFYPPPKVTSAVIRLRRNSKKSLDCDEKLFFTIVKEAFGKRRKTLRNALKPRLSDALKKDSLFDKRAERLGVDDFVHICLAMENEQ